MKRRAGGGGEEDHLSKRLKIHLELTSLQSQYNVQQEQVKAAKEQVKAAKEQLARLERELASTKEAKSKFVRQRNQIGVQFEPGPPNYPYQVNEAVCLFLSPIHTNSRLGLDFY